MEMEDKDVIETKEDVTRVCMILRRVQCWMESIINRPKGAFRVVGWKASSIDRKELFALPSSALHHLNAMQR
eukprot:764368-Hanusia_phi.AAC.1